MKIIKSVLLSLICADKKRKTCKRCVFFPSLLFLSAESKQIREIIKGRMRSAIVDMIYGLFEEELLSLCGKPYFRGLDKKYYRAGSDPGSVLAQGQRLQVRKPRVKETGGSDIQLKSYSALQSYDMICDKVLSLCYDRSLFS